MIFDALYAAPSDWSLGATILLLVVAGLVLDVVLRPLPTLAPAGQRRRRHALWAAVIGLYLVALAAL